jgi:hypothetical protein
MRADAAVAFHQRVNDFFASPADVIGIPLFHVLVLFATADVGRIGLNDFPFAAKRRKPVVTHRLAKPVRHEPRGFESTSQRPMKLVCGHTLFAGAHQECRL